MQNEISRKTIVMTTELDELLRQAQRGRDRERATRFTDNKSFDLEFCILYAFIKIFNRFISVIGFDIANERNSLNGLVIETTCPLNEICAR